VSTLATFLAAARTQLLTATGAILSEETIHTIQTSGRSPRHLEFAIGRTSETPRPGPQKVSAGLPITAEVLVIAAYQLRPKDRATSLDSAETYAASLRSALLASGWLSTTGAIVTFVGSDIAAGPDGWLWLTGKYLVSLTVDLS